MVRPWVQTDVPLRLLPRHAGASGRGRQRHADRALHRGGCRLHPGAQGPALLPLPGPLDAPRAAWRVAAVRRPLGERPLRRRRRDHRLERRPGARRAAGRRRRAQHARRLHQRQRAVDGHAAPHAGRSSNRAHRRGQRRSAAGKQGHDLGGRHPGAVPRAVARAHPGRRRSVPTWRRRWTSCPPSPASSVCRCRRAGPWTDRTSARFSRACAPSPVEWYVYNYNGRVEGVRDRRWKLHLTFPEKSEPVAALFDLLVDPSERWDVAAEHPDIVSRLRERLRQFAAGLAR